MLDAVLGWFEDLDGVPCLNVNVPPVEPSALRGIAAAELAPSGAVQSTVTEAGAGWVRVRYDPSPADHQAGTDAALLADGFATVTPLAGLTATDDDGLAQLLVDQPLVEVP